MSSVQFRSRIKPAFDYSDKLNSYGVCCGTSGEKTIISFTECFNEGGHFIPVVDGDVDSVSCPDSDTRLGCCVACSYVTPGELNQIPTLTSNGDVVSGSLPYLSSGFRSNVSRCECERLNGKWTEGTCPTTLSANSNDSNYWKTWCVKGTNLDARAPRSCCHLNFDENTGWPTGVACTDVCTSGDCGALSTQTYPSIFGSNRCTIPLVEGDLTTNCVEGSFYSLLATRTKVYEGFVLGSCYTLGLSGDSYVYDCAVTPESLCDGYWVAEADENNAFCDISFAPENPQKINGRYEPQTMELTAFQSLGLTTGDEYQGGVYIGIFQTPNDATTSVVYGNLNFGEPSFSKYNADSVGSSYTKWAIIVDETPYSVSYLNETEPDINYNTSLWDGYYNIYGDGTNFNGIQTALANTIKYQIRNGFLDYYLPSIYELHFYSAYLKRNNVSNRGILLSSSIFNTKYISSINKSKLGNNTFAYGQSILSEQSPNYQTIVVNKKSPQTVYFFRKIVLT